MTELVALSVEKHKNLKVSPNAQIEFAKNQQIMRIRVNEIPQAVTNFPVVFTRNGRDGTWVLSILTGLSSVQNTFIANGNWTAIFQPSAMQTHPFYLINSASESKGYTIGIDEKSQAFNILEGQQVFDEKSKPSLYLSKIKAMLESGIQQDIRTSDFIQNIIALDALKPIDLHMTFESGSNQKLAGIYVLDEVKLQQLGPDKLDYLNQKGFLVPMHTMLSSLNQMNALIRNNNSVDPSNKIVRLKMEVAKDDTLI